MYAACRFMFIWLIYRPNTCVTYTNKIRILHNVHTTHTHGYDSPIQRTIYSTKFTTHIHLKPNYTHNRVKFSYFYRGLNAVCVYSIHTFLFSFIHTLLRGCFQPVQCRH